MKKLVNDEFNIIVEWETDDIERLISELQMVLEDRYTTEEWEFGILNDAFIGSKVHRWIDDVISDYERRGMNSTSDSDRVLERLKDFREFVFQYYSAGNGDAIVKEEIKKQLSKLNK